MQQEVIKEMVLKNQKFKEIQKELEKKFGEQALKKTAIYNYIAKAKLGLPMIKDPTHSGNTIDEQLLITIRQEIEKNQFFSVRSLAYTLHCSPSLIYRYITNELHLVFKTTRWIPHSLDFM